MLNNRVFTCRYWALGPGCPDGPGRCRFSHRDTGRLATPTHQPGTCLTYSKDGYCYRGSQCGYEHRWTGVSGLHQGPIELTGLELEIADIAHKSGFNTTNHEALFNLIWAVKRTSLKIKPPAPLKPPHQIYPDRYRPDGIGDNTNKKRKRPNEDVMVKFNPVPSLMQRGGTKEDPIDLEDDKDKENIQPIKKVKNSQGAAELATPMNPVTKKILNVKQKLEGIRIQVTGCQAEMKMLFDKHVDKFDDDVLAVFENLAEAMNKAFDGAQDAGKYAEKAASTITFGGPVF